MSETGEVDGRIVIKVLEGNQVTVTRQSGGPTDMYVLAKGDCIECHRIGSEVRRRMLHYLARKFGVPIHHFYNPIEAWKPAGNSPQ